MGLIKGKKRNDAAALKLVRLVMSGTKGRGPVFDFFVKLAAKGTRGKP
jgi:hypothetical protein